jgi:hypothetical protein
MCLASTHVFDVHPAHAVARIGLSEQDAYARKEELLAFFG